MRECLLEECAEAEDSEHDECTGGQEVDEAGGPIVGRGDHPRARPAPPACRTRSTHNNRVVSVLYALYCTRQISVNSLPRSSELQNRAGSWAKMANEFDAIRLLPTKENIRN